MVVVIISNGCVYYYYQCIIFYVCVLLQMMHIRLDGGSLSVGSKLQRQHRHHRTTEAEPFGKR